MNFSQVHCDEYDSFELALIIFVFPMQFVLRYSMCLKILNHSTAVRALEFQLGALRSYDERSWRLVLHDRLFLFDYRNQRLIKSRFSHCRLLDVLGFDRDDFNSIVNFHFSNRFELIVALNYFDYS